MWSLEKKTLATYNYNSKEDLVFVKNNYGEQFRYAYDDLHNLINTVYPDQTTESLTYNKKKDWVMSFKNRKGCLESYSYGKNAKNSDHYYSKVLKKCGRKVVNKSTYEFWNKNLPSGKGKYLHRGRARVNGRLTDVIYHPQFGTPISFLKNGVRVEREYYSNGFLKKKEEPYRTVYYSRYSKNCRKPEQVRISKKDRAGKVIAVQNIQFQFTPNCQLQFARKSADEWIKGDS